MQFSRLGQILRDLDCIGAADRKEPAMPVLEPEIGEAGHARSLKVYILFARIKVDRLVKEDRAFAVIHLSTDIIK